MWRILTLIFGKPGAGKTALMTMFAVSYMVNGREDVINLNSMVNVLNLNGFKLSTAPDHLVYANYSIKSISSECSPKRSYDFNPFYFGIPNEKHPIQFVPPFSKLFIMEGQRPLNSRKSFMFSDYISLGYELHRHYDLDIFIDMQRPGLADLNVREICGKFIFVEEMINKTDRQGNIKKSIWKIVEFDDVSDMETWQKSSKNDKYKFGEHKTYSFTGDIFECYNSKEGFNIFMNDREQDDFSFEYSEDYSYSVRDIFRYNKKHNANVPDTYYSKGGVKNA